MSASSARSEAAIRQRHSRSRALRSGIPGTSLRIVAVIIDAAPVKQILLALGEPRQPPAISPARPGAILLRLGTSPKHPGLVVRCFIAAHPRAWDNAPEPAPDWDLAAQPELEFDQRIAW